MSEGYVTPWQERLETPNQSHVTYGDSLVLGDLSEILPFLDLIPPKEADIVELTMRGKTQADLAAIFGVTQAAISYNFLRGVRLIRWHIDMPPKPDSFEEDVRAVLFKPDYLPGVLYAIEICNVNVAARHMGMTQGNLNSQVNRCKTRLQGASHAYINYRMRKGFGDPLAAGPNPWDKRDQIEKEPT